MDAQAPVTDDLQFDKADVSETSDTPLACHVCERPLHDVYFDVDAQPSCEKCRYELEAERTRGSGPGRFARALLGGGLAGLVGAGIYYAVLALTGYEVGLVAIVVGFLVGFGVRWGSGGRGGWPYQILAVGITYVAIVSTYVPFVFEEIEKMEATAVSEAPAPAAEVGTLESTADGSGATAIEEEIGAGEALLALGVFALFVLAIPFLGGFQNILGILIIGFGLYQAWKINAYQPLMIEGPFRVGQGPPLEPAA
jgi:hypothetical protein